MELQEFITEFANAIEVDPSSISADTVFKDLDIWDSMFALTIIAMTDEIFGITLTGNDLAKSSSIADLWHVVESRSGK